MKKLGKQDSDPLSFLEDDTYKQYVERLCSYTPLEADAFLGKLESKEPALLELLHQML